VPTLLTGHSSHDRYHVLVVTSLSVHVLAASVWIGGLMALILMLRGSTRVLPSALPRFSHVALLCFMSIGLSGLVDVWIRLATLDQLWTTEYGRLVLAKTGALVVLGGFGWWHRRRTIRRCATDVRAPSSACRGGGRRDARGDRARRRPVPHSAAPGSGPRHHHRRARRRAQLVMLVLVRTRLSAAPGSGLAAATSARAGDRRSAAERCRASDRRA